MKYLAKLILSIAKYVDSWSQQKRSNPYNQPEHYRIESVIIWNVNKGSKHEATEGFVKTWSEFKFQQVKLVNVQNSLRKMVGGTDTDRFIMEVCYRVNQEGILHRILYEDLLVYPPYHVNDDRLPEFRFFSPDIDSARLCIGLEMDEYVEEEEMNEDKIMEEEEEEEENISETINHIKDVTEEVLQLAGPGRHFYEDTEVAIPKKLISEWLKLHTKNFDCMLELYWTNGEYEYF
jgi:hypothetical protein